MSRLGLPEEPVRQIH
uniref:Nudix hydrolase 7 n=1 Tax=Homo sapiens TaxID=9606 RepID=H3BMZ7_HUMAN